ncbi:MAG TPA: alpha/beta hydrolase [Lacunisphaera sp.]|nr:alpha/beta hydrolase [Lacunisphaera sp.]
MTKLPLFCLALAAAVSASAGLQTGIEYGTAGGESLKLDAYVPDGPGPFPAVILVHGGGWTAGDKSGGPSRGYMAPMHDPLARGGFAWFSINYRLAPKFQYPACVEDVETAIRWVKAHAAEYHLDPARIALAGESAGGHLVALVGTRTTDATRVAAIVDFYGRHDMVGATRLGEKLPGNMGRLFGAETLDAATEARLREASPLDHVRPGLPPFLLVHGTADASVPYQHSVALEARLKLSGVPCDFMTIKDGTHGMINWGKFAPGYGDQVVAWLKKTLN